MPVVIFVFFMAQTRLFATYATLDLGNGQKGRKGQKRRKGQGGNGPGRNGQGKKANRGKRQGT
jgi:hypothetical protein